MSDHSAHHVVPKSIYYLIFLALMVGTGLTWWVATIDLGMMNNVIMLAIAVTKATLVVMFFMHLRGDASIMKFVFIVPFALAVTLCLGFLTIFSTYEGIAG